MFIWISLTLSSLQPPNTPFEGKYNKNRRHLLPFIKSSKNYFISRLTFIKIEFFILLWFSVQKRLHQQGHPNRGNFIVKNFTRLNFAKLQSSSLFHFHMDNIIKYLILFTMKWKFIYFIFANCFFSSLFFVFGFGGWQWCMLYWI